MNQRVSLRGRLADRTKWPRSWWWPEPEKIKLSEEDWKKQHDEISKALNKLLLVLIGFCFFCGIALATPDRSLLASDATITLPLAETDISFASFLLIGPLVLTALSFYLHIFAGYWINLRRQDPVLLIQNSHTRNCHSFSICHIALQLSYQYFYCTASCPLCSAHLLGKRYPVLKRPS
jgi:hypothetical protein